MIIFSFFTQFGSQEYKTTHKKKSQSDILKTHRRYKEAEFHLLCRNRPMIRDLLHIVISCIIFYIEIRNMHMFLIVIDHLIDFVTKPALKHMRLNVVF